MSSSNDSAGIGKKHAIARDSLGRFPKGQSGNPNGRPLKGHSITETIKSMMDEKPEIKRALSNKILEYALKGDMTAIKLLWQYMDGMPTQRSEISGADGDAIQIQSFTDLIRYASTKPTDPQLESGEDSA